ncbi:hypothetical protein Godav_015165 [Gossypium davidsonii]|uniref:DUF7745 domain-containing protein n=1 Tax=Gossypium davidsonii TaxID=34287 RepID=A0A7J8RNP9_GOSDV|nr:hypothetical protein [Gossypium davidsonii]
MAILQNLQEKDVEWRAPWMIPIEILYRCGDFDWIPLLKIWGAIGYVPLLVLRQYRSRQFIPATQGLAQCKFSYKGDNYKKKGKIGELEEELQNCELRVELFERGNEQWQEQLHRSQGQIRERDYIIGEAVAQVREVADHLQTLVVQADVLSLKYESESSQGRELAWLLRKVKALSIKAKPYM